MEIPLLYHSEALVVVDKPSGWLTTPARAADDPRPVLGRRLQTQFGRQIYPVHRLDFEVSGLTLWALDADAHRIAQGWFESARLHKVYQAFTRPRPPAPREPELWTSHLVRGKRRTFAAGHGKFSQTEARVVREADQVWTWELKPLTGRPHQLRFELGAHGAPILGDTLYGGEAFATVQNWIALRAVRLDLSGLEQRLGLPEICVCADLTLPEGAT